MSADWPEKPECCLELLRRPSSSYRNSQFSCVPSDRAPGFRGTGNVPITSYRLHDRCVGEAVGKIRQLVGQVHVVVPYTSDNFQEALLIERHNDVGQFSNQIRRKLAKIFRRENAGLSFGLPFLVDTPQSKMTGHAVVDLARMKWFSDEIVDSRGEHFIP